ncbi:DUF2255 family protein [Burkholderia ambifaria]
MRRQRQAPGLATHVRHGNPDWKEELAMTWPAGELHRIVEADDLNIAPFRDDGKTPGTPTWIWCVAVDGELYVRAYNCRQSHGAGDRRRRSVAM